MRKIKLRGGQGQAKVSFQPRSSDSEALLFPRQHSWSARDHKRGLRCLMLQESSCPLLQPPKTISTSLWWKFHQCHLCCAVWFWEALHTYMCKQTHISLCRSVLSSLYLKLSSTLHIAPLHAASVWHVEAQYLLVEYLNLTSLIPSYVPEWSLYFSQSHPLLPHRPRWSTGSTEDATGN